ncbi:MAG: NUDIX domain-containing protein [Myxococcota bacterium]|nr:NUDIX domain-containing protein [Myxococcota bacterium]
MKRSAGILLARKRQMWEFFLLHTGGPFWVNKDESAWSFPKGELDQGEDFLSAAKREWQEETGMSLPEEPYQLLDTVSSSRKKVWVYLAIGDADPNDLKSNLYEEEWPRKSGETQWFPEADRAEWFSLETALYKIHRYLEPVLYNALRVLKERENRSS